MDNLTHTLVGAALAEAGLKKRTALGAATLMIGANFPDIDVVAVPLGKNFEWRRGITHGFPALVVLPFVLAGIMWLYDRHVRRRRNPDGTPADFRQLTILAAISILTHPSLDFMNSYGMRWLMPIVDRWFYADGLFIVDPWIILAFAVGIYWSRRARTMTPARWALGGVGVYIILMLGLTSLGRRAVAEVVPGRRMMVSPSAGIPWQREVVVELDSSYRMGSWSPFAGPVLDMAYPRWESVMAMGPGGTARAYEYARRAPEAQAYLRWVRFPAWQIINRGADTVVRVVDVRYCCGGWASVEVRLP